eukprot:3495573-Amphidinium_carterae.1
MCKKSAPTAAIEILHMNVLQRWLGVRFKLDTEAQNKLADILARYEPEKKKVCTLCALSECAKVCVQKTAAQCLRITWTSWTGTWRYQTVRLPWSINVLQAYRGSGSALKVMMLLKKLGEGLPLGRSGASSPCARSQRESKNALRPGPPAPGSYLDTKKKERSGERRHLENSPKCFIRRLALRLDGVVVSTLLCKPCVTCRQQHDGQCAEGMLKFTSHA